MDFRSAVHERSWETSRFETDVQVNSSNYRQASNIDDVALECPRGGILYTLPNKNLDHEFRRINGDPSFFAYFDILAPHRRFSIYLGRGRAATSNAHVYWIFSSWAPVISSIPPPPVRFVFRLFFPSPLFFPAGCVPQIMNKTSRRPYGRSARSRVATQVR